MRAAGIICECNPLHAGHQYLIEQARGSGADVIVCVMSGCFVQRGEAAIADGFLRSRALLHGGADAVLELPFPYSASSAEFFARAGVEILSRIGADEVWFGSESGDLAALQRAAEIADSEAFRAAYANEIRGNGGTAQTYFDCLYRSGAESASVSPNDILAISYLRAIRASGGVLTPRTVKRHGDGFRDGTVGSAFPSATALRALLRTGGIEAAKLYLTEETATLLDDAIGQGRAPADLAHVERGILSWFRSASAERIERIAEIGGGLGLRMQEAAREATTLSELLSLASTKKYTTARLQRGILFALTGIEEADLSARPAYVRLLAANGIGCGFLAGCRKKSDLAIVTRRADLPDTEEARRQAEWEARAWELYTLCMPRTASAQTLWKYTPFILPEGRSDA